MKRYPYFPSPENMDAIAHHPTPAILPAERLSFDSPLPSRGGGGAFVPFRRKFAGGGVLNDSIR